MAQVSSPNPSTTSQQCLYPQNKFDENGVKNVNSSVLTKFFHIWAVWPSFWPQKTHIQTWPRNHQNNLPDKFQEYLDQNCSH
jgi:hypothetical protein